MASPSEEVLEIILNRFNTVGKTSNDIHVLSISLCSSLLFQLAQKYFLKISINHFANTCLDSHGRISNGLIANGYSS